MIVLEKSYMKNTVSWYLEGSSGAGKKYIIPIDKDPFIIGRHKDCNLILASKEISRKHGKIFFKGEDPYLIDLKSTNGIYKNKTRIEGETFLRHGDIIHFGSLKYYIYSEVSQDESLTNTRFQSGETREDEFSQYFDLTVREKEILYLLLDGKSTKGIAETLCIAEGTAKNHVLKIFKKTESHSRVMLVNKFNDFGQGKG